MPTQGGGKPVKKTTRRGPTRAAALKALGLTQEDLDTLKALANLKPIAEPDTVEGSAVLHPTNLGDGPAPSDPQEYLEDRPSPGQDSWNAPDEDSAPVWYARNLRGVDVGFRLTRQQKQGEKRTNLKPRGARGDMIRLQPEDLKDPELSLQVGYNLIEVIPEGEALSAIEKQFTNQQTQVPNHIAMLRNPKGEEYAQANPVHFATDEEAYGVKVADVNPDLMKGNLSDREIARDAGLSQGIPTNTAPGGNPAIISDGFLAAAQTEDRSNNAKLAEVDAKFRAGQFEDRPEDNLGVKVTLAPTQRVN